MRKRMCARGPAYLLLLGGELVVPYVAAGGVAASPVAVLDASARVSPAQGAVEGLRASNAQ